MYVKWWKANVANSKFFSKDVSERTVSNKTNEVRGIQMCVCVITEASTSPDQPPEIQQWRYLFFC